VRARDGTTVLIDAEDVDDDLIHVNPRDDNVPSALGPLFGMRTVRAPIAIQHGNLLGNGRGLCIATRDMLEINAARGYTEDDVTDVLKRFYGAEEVVFLERLRAEVTGHVDMFATFTSPDTVVVCRCSPKSDPINAAILDRNAKRLASIGPPYGPLKVERVDVQPQPSGLDEFWPTYTNVVYANDVLLVPIYPTLDRVGGSAALALYEELLPDWTIVGIDSTPLTELLGGIHCLTMNLPSVGKLPPDASVEQPEPSRPSQE
jgi:agmatine/peptidylarginine deiminase